MPHLFAGVGELPDVQAGPPPFRDPSGQNRHPHLLDLRAGGVEPVAGVDGQQVNIGEGPGLAAAGAPGQHEPDDTLDPGERRHRLIDAPLQRRSPVRQKPGEPLRIPPSAKHILHRPSQCSAVSRQPYKASSS